MDARATPDRRSAGAFNLRRADIGDVDALGRMHIESWRETYVDLLPPDLVTAQTATARTRLWTRVIDDEGARVLVVLRDDAIVGFGSGVAQRDESLARDGFRGEISAIYVLRAAQGLGIGTALMRAVAADLSECGHKGAGLWVLRDNLPARRFYERLGGVLVGTREEAREQHVVAEVAYGWGDLSVLIAACDARLCRTRRPSTAR